MKALLVGERTVLNQRIAKLLEARGFLVGEASIQDDVLDILGQEAFDLLLLVAPEDESLALDLVSTCRAVRPSIHVYVLARDGGLSELIPKLQPALGKAIRVNDLANALYEQINRAEAEREHFRVEYLQHSEEVLAMASRAESAKDAAQRVIEKLHGLLESRGTAVVLLDPDQAKPPTAIASVGDIAQIGKVWKEQSAIYQWLQENQAPLLIRRGLSNVAGIQRDLVKFGLGPCAFVPILTSQRPVGMLVIEREPQGEPFSDSAFALLRIAGTGLALRLETTQGPANDDLKEMLQQEREWRQSLEDHVNENQETLRRLAREISSAVEIRKGHRQERSETIAKLAMALAEQLNVSQDSLQEAVYLRNIGVLAMPDYLGASREVSALLSSSDEDVKLSFEILSRVRLPSVVLEVARHHRENFDGSGQPDGQRGEEIPKGARIVRVVEDYIDMTVSGIGERSMPSPIALAQITGQSGKLYDPAVADVFVRLIRAQGVTPEQETLSLIAHELRTPLTFLMGFSELLAARQDLPGQAKEMASELHRQTEQMVTLTERLLELSRLQAGRVSLTWQWADIKQLIAEQVTKAKTLSDRHEIVVDAPPYPVRIRADGTRTAQAVANLLSNAIKYSPNGGNVLIRLQEGTKEIVISVQDQGLGIPKDKIDRLFQPFYRIQQPETQSIEGLGLGLAFTRAVVEAHGGKIWAQSDPGKGSVFYFSIPKQEIGVERPAAAPQPVRA